MISETEVKAKTDSELLEIWADQNDYVAEMMAWVKTEIERRNLDTSGTHVFTVEEKEEAAEASSNFTLVRILAFSQVATGLFLICAALWLRREELGPEAPPGGWLVGLDIHIPMPITLFAVGALLIVFAVGVWRGKRWAFTSGVIVYALITAFNILVTIVNGLAILRSNQPGDAAGPLILGVAMTAISGTLAWVFNALRKRGGIQDVRKRGEVSS